MIITFEDILNLFNLSPNFGEFELKNAKKMVLMTHPDKSKLDPEVFLFLPKLINTCILYLNLDIEMIKQYVRIWMEIRIYTEYYVKIKRKVSGKVFNELFRHKMRNEFSETGYENWLSSEEGLNIPQPSVKNMTNAEKYL